MLLWLYNSRFFISHSVPICDSRQIMWHLHYLYHKMLWFCWSSSFFEVGGFFCMYWCRWEKSHFIYNAILLAPKSSISDIYVVQLIQFYSLCFFAWSSQCRMSSDTSQGSNDVNSFNAWKWKYSKNFSFVMHT